MFALKTNKTVGVFVVCYFAYIDIHPVREENI